MKKSPLRSNPEKTRQWIERSRKPLNRNKPMPKAGKRTAKRQAMNRRLDKELKALGIDQCEIRLPGVCVRSIMLTHAHSRKSRFLVTDEDWMKAALCCIPCHDIIEAKSHEEMEAIVLAAIERRPKFHGDGKPSVPQAKPQ